MLALPVNGPVSACFAWKKFSKTRVWMRRQSFYSGRYLLTDLDYTIQGYLYKACRLNEHNNILDSGNDKMSIPSKNCLHGIQTWKFIGTDSGPSNLHRVHILDFYLCNLKCKNPLILLFLCPNLYLLSTPSMWFIWSTIQPTDKIGTQE